MGHVNPQWVEWLMGFETDWTALPAGNNLPANPVDPVELSRQNASDKRRAISLVRSTTTARSTKQQQPGTAKQQQQPGPESKKKPETKKTK
jgi:hypothetical protein